MGYGVTHVVTLLTALSKLLLQTAVLIRHIITKAALTTPLASNKDGETAGVSSLYISTQSAHIRLAASAKTGNGSASAAEFLAPNGPKQAGQISSLRRGRSFRPQLPTTTNATGSDANWALGEADPDADVTRDVGARVAVHAEGIAA